MPVTASVASPSLTAVASGAHSASTACASALSELVRVSPGGMERVSSASYTTVPGASAGSRRVVFTPFSVSPSTGVTSEPAYVVGTATCAIPVRAASALPSPIAEPPPIATNASAPVPVASRRASSVTATGVCTTGRSNRAASLSPSATASSSAADRAERVATSSTRRAPIWSTSSGMLCRAPRPSSTRDGHVSWTTVTTGALGRVRGRRARSLRLLPIQHGHELDTAERVRHAVRRGGVFVVDEAELADE